MPQDSKRPRVAQPPPQPHLLYDGDCGFCRFWVARWRARVREKVRYQSYQDAGERYPEVPPAASARAVQLIDTDGQIYAGADAVFRLLRTSFWGWLGSLAVALPLFRTVSNATYGFVASHRPFFSTLTRLGWGRNPAIPTYAVARRLFAHGLGVVFLVAFGSLAAQWRGLIGSRGIVPVAGWMDAALQKHGAAIFYEVPSVFWLGHSDAMLQGALVLASLLALALACGLAPGACALGLWALYLSFCSISSPFLDFQWDTLLLETALLGALFLPWSLRPQWRLTSRLATLGRWLLWWLLCRLMLESAIVKLSSGDPTWANLIALSYHYETQPLPLWTAWVFHQGPLWLHRLEALATFVVEFAGPLLMFGPRRLRRGAAWGMIGLQAGILLTGNYAFFNWLTILLCLLLLEDSHWPATLRLRLARRLRPPLHLGAPTLASRLLEPVGVLSAVITLLMLVNTLSPTRQALPKPAEALVRVVQPFRSFNAYGLFANMTTKRPEIVVEGSSDGEHWQAYEFPWKPGALDRRPRLVAPHQPRLDWQLWFAALSEVRREPWFVQFLAQLLQGSPDVLALVEWNPFPGTPPRYVRALLYEYHFTRFGEGSAWWQRELVGTYCPTLSIRADSVPGTPAKEAEGPIF